MITEEDLEFFAENAAKHEAGHVVVALHYGIEFSKVTIQPKVGEYWGLVETKGIKSYLPEWERNKDIEAMRQHAIFSVAGYAGEDDLIDSLAQEYWDTLYLGCRIAEIKSDDSFNQDNFINSCYNEATAIIEAHWKQFNNLVVALLHEKSLTYEQALKVFNRKRRLTYKQ